MSTPFFSLSLNGSVFGFFQGQRGIRQGDPMSPLIFTICMEYLTRILRVITADSTFQFHPLCKPLKLSHLCFVDDLLLFSKGKVESVMIILKAFATFSCASGLEMNKEKSEIYFNGVKGEDMQKILQCSGFQRCTFPFRYLGIPITFKRIGIGDCHKLVERMVGRIRGWGAKKLSYAGRLVLVQSILSQLHTYWARIFIIPTKVLNQVNSICRNYLWGGSDVYGKSPLVAWDTVCRTKKEGGLGVLQCKYWNMALIRKYTW